jgi:LTXXQ motif family protein
LRPIKGEEMMQSAFRVILLAVGILGAPTAATILSPTILSSSPTSKASQVSLPVHDSRAIAASLDEDTDRTFASTDFAEAIGWPWEPPVPRPDARISVPPGAPPIPQPPGARFRIGLGPPPPLPPSTRSGCEEEIDRLTGLAGYLKSKIHLQGAQKEAWQKLEFAAAAPVEKLRELCSALPAQPEPPTRPLERIDFAEKQTAIRLELFRAIHDPLHALYESLSADQRALLAVPLHPLVPMFPLPHLAPAP